MILEEYPMKTVIINTTNAVFNFNQKEVMEFFICNGSEYDPAEIARLLKLISTDSKNISRF